MAAVAMARGWGTRFMQRNWKKKRMRVSSPLVGVSLFNAVHCRSAKFHDAHKHLSLPCVQSH